MVSSNYIDEQEGNINSTKRELSAERQQHQAQSKDSHKDEEIKRIC
jgi:hypothetical protein